MYMNTRVDQCILKIPIPEKKNVYKACSMLVYLLHKHLYIIDIQNGYMSEMDGSMDGWMDGWKDEWMSEWIREFRVTFT